MPDLSKSEKIVVFDESGNPKELRYYENEKLIARLGTILDAESNFIGLRELDVEEVSPSSWLDKLRGKRPQNRISILTVDFIGLINWINTIKTIKTIENIDLIKLIREAHIFIKQNLFLNGNFELADLSHWISEYASVSTSTPYEGSYFVRLTAAGYIKQKITPTNAKNLKIVSMVRCSAAYSDIFVTLYFTDGTSENIVLDIAPADINTWQLHYASSTTDKVVHEVRFYHAGSGNLDIDDINGLDDLHTILSLPSVTVSSLPAITGTLTQSTKHDVTVYKQKHTKLTADGDIIAAVANKIIYVHAMKAVMGADTEGDVRDDTAGNIIDHLPHNDREGNVMGFASYPAAWLKSASGKALYWDMSSATGEAYFTVIYSEQST